MSGGFAGGLAQGINQGVQMYALNESLKSREKQDARMEAGEKREAEAHDIKMQELANDRKLTETWAGILGWKPEMAGGSPVRPDAPSMGAPAEPPQTPSSIKLAGPVPEGGLAMAAPSAPFAADNPAGALQPQQPQQQAAPAQQAAPVSADQYVQKQILTGNAFGNPQILNQMAAAAFQHGKSDKAIAFLNQAHIAHEKGLPAAIGKLMEGDGTGAADLLRSRGMDVRGDLTPVEGKEHIWSANIGGEQKEISVRNLVMAANPLEAFKNADAARETARKAELEERKFKLDEQKQASEDKKTEAEVATLKDRGSYLRSLAGKADRDKPGGLRASRSTEKQIDTAINRRDKQLDNKSMVMGEVDPDKRAKYDEAAFFHQDLLEEAFGEELSARDHHKMTDALLTYPVEGTKDEIRTWQRGFFRRFGLDDAGKLTKTAAKPEPGLAGNKAAPQSEPAPEGLKPRKEPTREELELEAARFDAEAVRDLKKLHRERTASNLSAKDREELENKISAILERTKPKGQQKTAARNRAPSSDPEVAPAGYGKRRDGTDKGRGWLGVHKTKSGNDMTEYTVGLDFDGKNVDVPTLVPGLTDKELAYLKTEPDLGERTPINDSIIRKAAEHARKRMREGKSVFAD